MTSPSGLAAFRAPAFARFWSARLLSGLALQMETVAVGWLVYSLTHDPFALGLVGLFAFVPSVGLALVTGHVADVADRCLVLVACYGTIALGALSLAVLSWWNVQLLWPLYLQVGVVGTARAFANPAAQALLPNLVPPALLGNAVALSSTAWQLSAIVGPALGGFLYAFGGSVVFGTVTILFAASVVLLLQIESPARQAKPPDVTWAALVAGIHYIRARPVILGAISLDLFAVLFGGATAMLPVYVHDVYRVGPWALGLLRSMPAAGALLMAAAVTHRPLSRRTGRRLFQAVAVFGLATIGFGVSTSLWVALPFLFVLGASDLVSVVIRQTLVQTDTPDAMRGRVAAVNSVFIGASNELGEFESGTLAALVGVVPSVVLGGLGTLAVVLLWRRWFPALRDRDRLVEPSRPPAP
ncbi:MAG TPA: MFS transporter [Chthoniobacterales bacterium]